MTKRLTIALVALAMFVLVAVMPGIGILLQCKHEHQPGCISVYWRTELKPYPRYIYMEWIDRIDSDQTWLVGISGNIGSTTPTATLSVDC